jgi:Tol biopolymer transport system component
VTGRSLCALAVAAILVGCGDDSTGPQFLLEIEIDGRIERSAVARLYVSFEGAAIDDSSVTWTADPMDAAEFPDDGLVEFLADGRVILSAQAETERGLQRGRDTVDVAVPPLIVFDLLSGGNRDIYRAAIDGGDLLRLTEASADDVDPTAAVGEAVFTSFRDGNAELYSVPLSGGTPQRLTETADDEIQPALSPDGARLAYAFDPTGIHKLWTANADGSGSEAATPGFGTGGSVEGSPSWAPTGDRLAFISTTNGTADIFDLRLNIGTPTLLIGGGNADVEPAWHPERAEVVFVSNRTGDTELFLYVVATQELTQLTDRPGSDGEPAWLPDGRIVYTAWVNNVPQLRWLDPQQPESVHAIPVDLGTPRRASGVGN